jgi:endonuclease I
MKIKFTISLLFFTVLAFSQPRVGYYNSAVGKKEAVLKTALYQIIKIHDVLEYYSSSTSFLKTDWHPDGYFWDMYSNNKRTYWSGMNREHNMPKSWWSSNPETTIAYTDLHNLYPSDATANSAKSNYPLGIVNSNPIFTNGAVKVGTNTFTGYNGLVFEPGDEFKGDFARDYMYMVTCYEDYKLNWRSLGTSSMLLSGGTYPVFKPYAINLLLQWHRNDKVSSKEKIRNNEVEKLQKNRNPFIDFPVLAEFLWGKYAGQQWSGEEVDPEGIDDFYIYYNADNKRLFVKVNKPEMVKFIVYSINGMAKLEGNLNADAEINVEELHNGLYILLVYSGTNRFVHKFSKW